MFEAFFLSKDKKINSTIQKEMFYLILLEVHFVYLGFVKLHFQN
jgi:hypothetical protein